MIGLLMHDVSVAPKGFIVAMLTLLSWIAADAQESNADMLDHGNARIVLLGDSITGLSRNAGNGFAHQMEWALKQTFPDSKPDIIALGGSGQGVGSWVSVERGSRTEERFLDVPKIPVKATLDQHADLLVIMLGMNDVLAPYVLDEPESLQKWTDSYRELIKALQARLTPKITALATPTLCTEDVHSPKNVMMGKLIDRAQALAKEMNLLVLPTNAGMQEVLKQGRRVKLDFHVTYDFIHPNEAGHLSIAMGMLRGLGVPEAARRLGEERLKPLLEKARTAVPAPVEILPLELPLGFRAMNGTGAVRFTRETSFSVPSGWPFDQEDFTGSAESGGFYFGRHSRMVQNIFEFGSRGRRLEISRRILAPAVWHVAAGLMRLKAWKNNQTFDLSLARGPVEEAIEQQRILAGPIVLGDGQKLEWHFYYPTADYTGGDVSGCVNFDAVTHARTFEGGVAARWIFSEYEQPVYVDLSTQALSPSLHLAVYLNGQSVYAGLITSENKKHKALVASLRRGWNSLAFTLDHVAWQMQCRVDVQPVDGSSLDDFNYFSPEQTGGGPK